MRFNLTGEKRMRNLRTRRYDIRVVLPLLMSFYSTCTLCDSASAQSGEQALRARIIALEAENQALRKLLIEIQTTLANTPPATPPAGEPSLRFRIVVEPGDWGTSSLADTTKVCESTASAFIPYLSSNDYAPLLISNDASGPITLYRRGANHEHLVRLNTANRAWAQLVFQFSHELCHILCNYRNVKNPQLWFEETLCECASLFALRQMANTWKTDPPYSNWKSYSSALNDYAAQRLKIHQNDKQSAEEIYVANRSKLESSGTDRDLNNRLAAKLLPLFEKDPTAWEAVQYLNRGPAEENGDFQRYLKGWYERVPEQKKVFVVRMAKLFGLSIRSE
jgi:hypothetical protein